MFLTLFKIFFLVVAFGLYHRIIVMPVVLSLIGPKLAMYLHDRDNGGVWDEQQSAGAKVAPTEEFPSAGSRTRSEVRS